MAIGPTLPPGMAPRPAHAQTEDDSSDDDYGPALPPDLTSAPPKPAPAPPSASAPSSSGPASTVALGPVRPPAHYQATEEEEDDELGPAPLPAPHGRALDVDTEDEVAAFRAREKRQAEADERAALLASQQAVPKRDEWMLAPPPSGSGGGAAGLLGSLDTTKLKSRGFNTAPGASSKNKGKKGEVDLWTETPEERQKRLTDEAMGVRRKAEKSAIDDDDDDDDSGMSKEERRRKRERDEGLRRQVAQYNERTRNETLLDLHSDERVKKRKKEEAGVSTSADGPPGVWDRERDMGIRGGPMDPSKRKNMIKDAKGLGGRFGGGTFL